MAEQQQSQQQMGAQRTEGELMPRGQPRRRARGAMAAHPLGEMERMMESLFPRGWMRPFGVSLEAEQAMPAVDVIERNDEILVRAEMPGVTKENVDVSVREGVVTLRGHMDIAEETQGEYVCRELPAGEIMRTIQLPTDVDADKAKAQMRNGILELTLPKSPAAKRRSIPIE